MKATVTVDLSDDAITELIDRRIERVVTTLVQEVYHGRSWAAMRVTSPYLCSLVEADIARACRMLRQREATP